MPPHRKRPADDAGATIPDLLFRETGRHALLVRHPGFVDRMVSMQTDPDHEWARSYFRSLPGHEHWLGEPPVRVWTDRAAAEAFAARLRAALDDPKYRIDVVAEILVPRWDDPPGD